MTCYAHIHQNNKQALHSLFRNAHVTHMKRTSHSIRSQTMRHVKSYLNGTSIMNLARKCNYPPSMMARLIVENVSSSSFTNKNANNMQMAMKLLIQNKVFKQQRQNIQIIIITIRNSQQRRYVILKSYWEMHPFLYYQSISFQKGMVL